MALLFENSIRGGVTALEILCIEKLLWWGELKLGYGKKGELLSAVCQTREPVSMFFCQPEGGKEGAVTFSLAVIECLQRQ